MCKIWFVTQPKSGETFGTFSFIQNNISKFLSFQTENIFETACLCLNINVVGRNTPITFLFLKSVNELTLDQNVFDKTGQNVQKPQMNSVKSIHSDGLDILNVSLFTLTFSL